MDLKTFIFIGRSGCGKGTQAKMLIEKLGRRMPGVPVQYLEAGARFRELIARGNLTAQLSKAAMDAGDLQPSFLAIHAWAHLFIENVTGNEHIVLDGSPRKLDEAKILAGALRFYNRPAPTVLYINVSKKWSTDRLLGRGRRDDTSENIEQRLSWFDTQVIPAIELLAKEPGFMLLDINGEQTIEEVHKEIMSKVWP